MVQSVCSIYRDTRWNQVADKCYQIVEEVKKYNNGTGLVPDWCTASGTPASGQSYDYKYDATRYGWRTAVDYSWFGDQRAKANCDMLTKFFARDGQKESLTDTQFKVQKLATITTHHL